MRKFTLLVITVLMTTWLAAQVQWQAGGIPVRQGVNIEWSRSSAVLDDGHIIYVWSDTRRGDRDLWAQKIDQNGLPQWGENSNLPAYPDMIEGIMINGEINRQEDPVVIYTGNGEVIVAWVDFRNEDAGDIYAQKLDIDGNLLWDPSGVPLCLAEGIQISLNIVNDANGGAYVIWLDNRFPGGSDIYGTHILSNGEIAAGWTTDGNPIANASGSQNQHTFWEDGTGGAIIAWHDERNPNDENVYCQRIASDGSLLWDVDGTLLCDAPGAQENVKITPDINGDFIFAWRDKRSDSFGDIYAQKVNLNGDFLWGTGMEVYAGEGIQRNPRISPASDGGAFVVWEDGRDDFFKDIYVQKLDTNGNKIWNPEGVAVVNAMDDQLNPRMIEDDAGGCWIAWDDSRLLGYPHVDIYMQHLSASGTFTFAENGMIVCDAPGEQFAPLVKINSENNIVVNWGDARTGSIGMFLQVYDTSGNELLIENGEVIYYGLSGDAINYHFIANDDNPAIVWVDTRFSSVANQIFMQVLNPDGSFALDINGVPVTQVTGYDQGSLDVVFNQEDGIIGITWAENRMGYEQIYTQAVDLAGNFIWSDEFGLPAGFFNSQQESPKISMKSSGSSYDYFVGWSDFRENWDFGVCAQRIRDGELQWDEAGITIIDLEGDDRLADLVEDYFVWQGGTWDNSDIYVKRVDLDGNTAPNWPEDGLLICGAENHQDNAQALMIPEGLLIVWQDLRNGDYDIYGQIVTPDAQILWQENGLPLVEQINDQTCSNVFYDGNIVMIWDDFRTGLYFDIYMQKFDIDGNELLTPGGLEIIAQDSQQETPYITTDGTSYLTFWEDYVSETESDLHSQLITSDGELQWSPEGFVISDDIKNQKAPMAVTNNGHMAYVIWEDTRSSGKTDIYNIYAQKIDMTITSSENNETGVPMLRIAQNYPNPFNPETTISFDSPQGDLQDFRLNIFNLKGQKIRSIQPESTSIVWDGRDDLGNQVANGIYLYRLESDQTRSATRKMVLLK